jgi:hypothetical protein
MDLLDISDFEQIKAIPILETTPLGVPPTGEVFR